MATKRFFTKNHERVGKKSGKIRGKYKKQGIGEPTILLNQPSVVADKPKTQKSPSISRKITETLGKFTISVPTRFSWKMVGFIVFFSIILGLSIWQGIVAIQKSLVLKEVVAQRVALAKQMSLWDSIAAQYPGYRDAYFQAAILAYRLGDKTDENAYLEKALEIDPNYEPAKNLERLQ